MSESELRSFGETVQGSVQMESGEYIATTTAYHLVHCIVQNTILLLRTSSDF